MPWFVIETSTASIIILWYVHLGMFFPASASLMASEHRVVETGALATLSVPDFV